MQTKAQPPKKRVALLALGLGALAGLWSPPAEAQSIKVEATQYRFKRLDSAGVEKIRPSYPFWISRDDCLKDKAHTDHPDGETFIEVQPNLSPVGNYSLQVWVSRSADCTDPQIRLTQGSCWKVLDVIAQINNQTYELSPQEILAGGEPLTEEICDKQVEWSTTLFFMLFDGDTLLAHTKWTETQVDTKAPPPPNSLTASGGDNAIFLNWTVPLEQQVLDAQGFAYYCAGGGMEVVGQAGANGMGGQTGTSCVAGDLAPGEHPPEDALCGSVGSPSARSGVVNSSVANGTTYGVGIAATDRVGNVGTLSSLTCATPEPVIGFFERYKSAGGRAGGSFCGAVPGIGAKNQGALWALGLMLAVFGLRRWRVIQRPQHERGPSA